MQKKNTTQSVTKPRPISEKVMLFVRWHWKGIVHYRMLPPGRTIDPGPYHLMEGLKATSNVKLETWRSLLLTANKGMSLRKNRWELLTMSNHTHLYLHKGTWVENFVCLPITHRAAISFSLWASLVSIEGCKNYLSTLKTLQRWDYDTARRITDYHQSNI